MNRREWLRGAALISAGVVAADQLDLLDRLGWTRRFFAGANFDEVTIKLTQYNARFMMDGREVRFPLDLTKGYGVASIPEGGVEAFVASARRNYRWSRA